jgi:hypothetical protein
MTAMELTVKLRPRDGWDTRVVARGAMAMVAPSRERPRQLRDRARWSGAADTASFADGARPRLRWLETRKVLVRMCGHHPACAEVRTGAMPTAEAHRDG